MAGAMTVVSPFAASTAYAGGSGCGHPHAVECYQKVQVSPDLYTTRYKHVMVKPGWWETKTIPAVYGSRQKRVMVAPGRTVVHQEPAQWGVVYEQKVVKPATTRWVRGSSNEHRRFDLFDRLRHPHGHAQHVHDEMCKVEVPAQMQTVERRVQTAPAKRVVEHIPARYEWVDEPYLIQPAKTTKVYHQPVYERVAERVLVKKGEMGWRPSEHRRGLFDFLRRERAPEPAPMPVHHTPLK
jgi:hypothetical protein